ncbi:unnamed protein product [Soboliphyme baturini]|uniref:RNA-binding protein 45 n=1 Tax=Soboliphyme baturini TaxID=241478 RepID=A0A183IS76_9BILA|nr:unnamed protein product [Soboliphyme baturini]
MVFPDMASDYPPNSRLFVLCAKDVTEDELHAGFDKFGQIEDVWIVRSKSGEAKGTNENHQSVCYVKFSKASEACKAMEEMNRATLGQCPKPIKVMIASGRSEGSRRDPNEHERLMRLFIVVPPGKTKEEIVEHFQSFGDVVDVHVVKSGRIAYIRFAKASESALALEECDREYRAKFADPKRSDMVKSSGYRDDRGVSESLFVHEDSFRRPVARSSDDTILETEINLMNNPSRCKDLFLKFKVALPKQTVWHLCDMIPGLKNVEIKPPGTAGNTTIAFAQYATVAAATWARQKFPDLEYPPFSFVEVRYADAGYPAEWDDELDEHSPAADESRAFFVCNRTVSIEILKDAFSAYGELVDIFYLPDQNCGYACFVRSKAANAAIAGLDGTIICGERLKIYVLYDDNVDCTELRCEDVRRTV